ncbi:MAG: hypothetical protein M1834_003264 [Cirrosporium novae-zelandiae]|nr:MAG: hypothetical protein M1834_003264 [Cirrosporium novae-zelandiae]
MPSSTNIQKSQPWKAQWPAKAASPGVAGTSGEIGLKNNGTQHGFLKGETVILDGNISGPVSEPDEEAGEFTTVKFVIQAAYVTKMRPFKLWLSSTSGSSRSNIL